MKANQWSLKKFIKTLKAKIYQKMTANDSKSYLPYLNNFVINTIILIIILLIKNLLMLIILLWLNKLRQILKLLTLKWMIELELLSVRASLVMVTLKTFIIDFVLKINPWTYKTKDLNREKTIGSFYENALLRSKL